MNIKTAAFGDKRTPTQVLISAQQDAENYDCVVVVVLDKDGYVDSAWSDGSALKRMGMLDVAKVRMMKKCIPLMGSAE